MKSQRYSSDRVSPQTDTVVSSLDDIEKLRQLLLGKEHSELLSLKRRLNNPEQHADVIAGIISEALAKRSAVDDSLADALSSTIEQALQASVKKDPQPIATAIFPVIGPAIRKAIQEALNSTLERINDLLSQGLSVQSLRWRFEAWRSGTSYSEFVLSKTLVYRVEQAFLIHRHSSLLLAHLASDDIDNKDPDIISGMLTAITDFIVDAFDDTTAEGASVDSFQLGDLTVKVQAGPVASLALVIRGTATPKLTEIQHETLEYIHRLYGTEILAFDQSNNIESKLSPILENCLLQQSQQKEKQASKWKAWLLLACILLGFGLWQLNQYIMHTKWQQVISSVVDEPGLVVLDQGKKKGLFYLSGLKDTLARVPEEFLPEDISESLNISWRWSSYFSSEPEIILKRLQTKISIPSSVSLQVIDQTLLVSGEGDKEWFEKLEQAIAQTPGINSVDKSGFKVLSSSLDAFLAESKVLQSKQLYFASGRYQLAETQNKTIKDIIVSLEKLYRLSKENNYPLQVLLRGHGDSMGPKKSNQTLSDSRADMVLKIISESSELLRNANVLHNKGYADLFRREAEKNNLLHNRRVDIVVQSPLLE